MHEEMDFNECNMQHILHLRLWIYNKMDGYMEILYIIYHALSHYIYSEFSKLFIFTYSSFTSCILYF